LLLLVSKIARTVNPVNEMVQHCRFLFLFYLSKTRASPGRSS
jgi:hypothetical protein